jgi:adenylate kinase
LDEVLAAQGNQLDVVVELTVNPDIVIDRIRVRSSEQGRTDDTEDVMRNRLELYARETAPLIQVYGARGILVSVDGIGLIDDVTGRIVDGLGLRGFRA